jgi:5-methylcytosine-specific restriction endonuclease McrA
MIRGTDMAGREQELRKIYDRTTGYCHICHKKLAFKNYGVCGKQGAWENEHSNPRANGGTNRSNNLYAACIRCNRSKGANATRSARARHGKTRAPLCVEKRKNAKLANAVAYGLAGAGAGSVLGPVGTLVGALIGTHVGSKKNPDR